MRVEVEPVGDVDDAGQHFAAFPTIAGVDGQRERELADRGRGGRSDHGRDGVGAACDARSGAVFRVADGSCIPLGDDRDRPYPVGPKRSTRMRSAGSPRPMSRSVAASAKRGEPHT